MDTKNSPSLAELQSWLRGVFTEPRGIRVALEKPSPLLNSITDAPPLPIDERLDVYASAYFSRLLESMETDFPATRRALGAEDFRQLTADYLSQHPSTSPNVADLGSALPSFVVIHPLSQRLPFLPDLVRLEWNVLESLYANRLPPLDPSSLQKIPPDAWPEARLVLDPTVRLLKTEWAVEKLWEKRRQPENKRGTPLKHAQPRWFLIHRDDVARVSSLEEARWYALQCLQTGIALGPLCEELPKRFPKQASTTSVMHWFADWVHAGVIKKIELEEAS